MTTQNHVRTASFQGAVWSLCRVTAWMAMACLLAACSAVAATGARNIAPLTQIAATVQPKVVKIYGAGGFRRLEAYQTGLLCSKEGHIVTVWSYVLDADPVVVILKDGRRYEGEVLGVDPIREIAVLKVDADIAAHFPLESHPLPAPGHAILAFVNAFGVATGDEAVSVLQGRVSAITRLEGRSGAHRSPYQGDVLVVDAITSNPGAAGGALTDRRGRLLGMVGRELRDATNGTWLNYALPTKEVSHAFDAIVQGKTTPDANEQWEPENPLTPAALGIVLVPDVVDRTPPFVDHVRPASPAARGGVLPDDLIVLVNDQFARSCQDVVQYLAELEAGQPLTMSVLRNKQLVIVTLEGSSPD